MEIHAIGRLLQAYNQTGDLWGLVLSFYEQNPMVYSHSLRLPHLITARSLIHLLTAMITSLSGRKLDQSQYTNALVLLHRALTPERRPKQCIAG